MYTKAAILAALASFTTAAPTSAPVEQFGIIATHSTSPVHLQTINASGRGFFIGKPAATYCPTGVENLDCSKFQTSSTILSAAPGTGGTSLAVTVPGGQQIYVGPDGALGFTQAHSSSVPEGSRRTPFEYTPQIEEGTVGNLSFNGKSFLACPTQEGDAYQVYSEENTLGYAAGGCIAINLATSRYENGKPTWQYV